MEKYVVNLETAKLLDQLEFDEECFYTYIDNETLEREFALESVFEYTGNLWATKEHVLNSRVNDYECYLAPFREQVLRWLRENHCINIELCYSATTMFKYYYLIYPKSSKTYTKESSNHSSYEEAIDNAILYCLTNLIKE
jgi:hypothetical protein